MKKNGKFKDGGEVDMCKAIDDMIDEGRAEGRSEGMARVNRLNELLISEKRFEELKRATEDAEYQKELLTFYAI